MRGNWFQALTDSGIWLVSVPVAAILRFEFRVADIDRLGVTILAGATLFLWLILSGAFRIYSGLFRPGSFEELRRVVAALGGLAIALGSFFFVVGSEWNIPGSLIFIAPPIFLIFAGGSRIFRRTIAQRRSRNNNEAARAIVYGAGTAAESLIPQLLKDPISPYLPVALIDDDLDRDGYRIGDLRVEGSWSDLPKLFRKYAVEVVIVAIPSVSSGRLRAIYSDAKTLGLKVVVVPTLRDFLSGDVAIRELKDVAIEDLIGRPTIYLDPRPMRQLVEGKRILVTGAGGSIGAELAVQIARNAPATLLLADRDESGLLAVSMRIRQQTPFSTDETYLVDIRDAGALSGLFAAGRPEVVFHAAALKHLAILERHPSEGWKTNVDGTLNMLECARGAGVSIFVNISTDKAANPANVLGRTKRLAEQLTAWFASQTGLRYVSVRFGNVLGSRGSLVPILAKQIAVGGPLTVTHKDATRYFMSISEACELVLQAAAEGVGGDVLVLDMGEPVRIQDIAERMIELSGRSIDIVYTGLRPGEKLHEDLLSDSEEPLPSSHPKIMRLKATPKSPEEVLAEKW